VWLQYPPWCVAVSIPSKKDVVAGEMTILDGDSIPLVPSSRTIEVDAKLSLGRINRPPGSESPPCKRSLPLERLQTIINYSKQAAAEPGAPDGAVYR